MAKEPLPQKGKFPPLIEKGLPIFVAVMTVLIAVVVLFAAAVALGWVN